MFQKILLRTTKTEENLLSESENFNFEKQKHEFQKVEFLETNFISNILIIVSTMFDPCYETCYGFECLISKKNASD